MFEICVEPLNNFENEMCHNDKFDVEKKPRHDMGSTIVNLKKLDTFFFQQPKEKRNIPGNIQIVSALGQFCQ